MRFIVSPIFWLIIILILGFIVRIYKINEPLADWHSWRQADTASVTRNFIEDGFSPFMPRFDDMSATSDLPIPNIGRFRFVEFPIYNIVVYPLYLFFEMDIKYHRLVSIFFSLGSSLFIYLITKRYLNAFVVIISVFIFTFLPFNIFFSRTTLPEPTFLFFALGMVYFIDSWLSKKDNFTYSLSFLFTTIAFLIKPWAIFFLPPLIYSFFQTEGKDKMFKKFIILFSLSIIPFVIWRIWILQFPEGIPANLWLLNSDGIRFKPVFWWWIISERMGKEILGVTGVILFFIGLLIKTQNLFFHLWFVSAFLFIIIFATGNVRHDYYQIIFTPILSIFTALGFYYLIKGVNFFIPRIYTIILALLFFSLIFYFTWNHVKGFYQINNYPIVKAGNKANDILPKDALVLAPYNGDTAFIYQIQRSGWPVITSSIQDMIADFGITHYISMSKDNKTIWAKRHFEILADEDDFTIIDLTKLKEDFRSDPEPF